MMLLRRFPLMVLMLALLSMATLCAAHYEVGLLIVAGVLGVLSWRITEGPRGRTLPRWVSGILVIAAAMQGLYDFIQHAEDVPGVLGRFTVWLTVIKLYDRRSARDHAHVMSLCLLLVLISCLGVPSLLFGVLLALTVLVGLDSILLYQLYAGHERSLQGRRRAARVVGGALPQIRPTLGRRPYLHFRFIAGLVTGVAIILSLVLFTVFPRTTTRSWSSMGNPFIDRVTGYADEIDLDSGTRITTATEPVFEVSFTTPSGDPLQREQWRLAGAVLDVYQGGRWSSGTAVTGPPITVDAGTMRTLAPYDPASGIVQAYDFVEPSATIFSVIPPVAISGSKRRKFSFDASRHTLEDLHEGTVDEYTLISSPSSRPPLPRRSREGYFIRPTSESAKRVAALAQRLLAEAGLPLEPPEGEAGWRWRAGAVRVFTRHLQSGVFEYTLDRGEVARGADPTAQFLLESRLGHCEFFASGLAALCQTVGIEARLVSGFVASELDEERECYIVRASNAHAWVEVRTRPDRFVEVDPTPPGSLTVADATGPRLGASMRRWYRRLEGEWYRGFVQFDSGVQDRLWATVQSRWFERTRGATENVMEWMATVNRSFRLGPAGYIWLGLVGAAIIIAVVALLKIIRRVTRLRRTFGLRRVSPARSRWMLRQLGFYHDMLEVLARQGRPKPEWQPPLAYAQVLKRDSPDAARLVRRLTEIYYEARYAGRTLPAETVRDAEAKLAQLANVLEGDS